MTYKCFVKICGLMADADIDAVNEACPDAAGFILTQGFRRSVAFDDAVRMAARVNPGITTVGVFVDEHTERIERFVSQGIIGAIQLHGSEDEAYIATLRERLGDVPVIKAFEVRDKSDLERARASSADLVLLDSGKGTGSAFDWSLLEGGIGRNYLLAGGLGPGNVADAVEVLRPFGVDMSSGVETHGRKDPDKIMRAVTEARSYVATHSGRYGNISG